MKFQLTGYSKDGELLGIADVLANDEIEAERIYRAARPEICAVKVEVIVALQLRMEVIVSTPVTTAPGLTPVNRDAAKLLRPMPESGVWPIPAAGSTA